MRHGRGAVPGAVARGRGAAGAPGEAGGRRAGVGDRRSGGPRRTETADCREGDQGAGRRPRSHSSWGRHAFARPGAHTPPRHGAAPSRHAPARAPHRTPLFEYSGARSSTCRPCSQAGTGGRAQALAWECVCVFSFSTSHLGKLRQKAGTDEADLTFQPTRQPPYAATLNSPAPSGHTHVPRLPPSLLRWASALLRGGRAPSLSSNHSYFQEGGVWVEGFLQTNPRLRSVRGPAWGRG